MIEPIVSSIASVIVIILIVAYVARQLDKDRTLSDRDQILHDLAWMQVKKDMAEKNKKKYGGK